MDRHEAMTRFLAKHSSMVNGVLKQRYPSVKIPTDATKAELVMHDDFLYAQFRKFLATLKKAV